MNLTDENIIEITDELSTEYEISKVLREYPKDTVIVKNVKGYDMPVVTGICNTRDKIAKSINCEVSEITEKIIDAMETVTATTEYFLLGRWVEQAKALGANADDFTKELYEFNAKALVTTWGSYNQAESGGLKDYSNRQWSGLIGDFYKVRWERWINARTSELKGEQYETSINWFEWEWSWVRSNTEYTTAATPADLKTLGLDLWDIKFEFGYNNDEVILIDEIASGNMRVYKDGKIVDPVELTKIINNR